MIPQRPRIPAAIPPTTAPVEIVVPELETGRSRSKTRNEFHLSRVHSQAGDKQM